MWLFLKRSCVEERRGMRGLMKVVEQKIGLVGIKIRSLDTMTHFLENLHTPRWLEFDTEGLEGGGKI